MPAHFVRPAPYVRLHKLGERERERENAHIPVSPVMQLHLYVSGDLVLSTAHGFPLAQLHSDALSFISSPPPPAVRLRQITAFRTPDWLVNVCQLATLPVRMHCAYLVGREDDKWLNSPM